MNRIRPLIAALALTTLAAGLGQQALEGTTPAPAFPEGLDWLNSERALTLEDLRGKVVILDFWTYGCINCIHMIPVLKQLEEAYPDELVVIGVHSGKFDNERDTGNIASIVARYELEHPVVNDLDFAVWRAYGVRAWPTFMVIDPVGKVVGQHSGEAPFELFDSVITRLLATFEPRGELDRSPLPIGPQLEAVARPLLFPGKVLADDVGGRLFISDSNHNRIVVTSLEGDVQHVIGSSKAGFRDGSFEEASFFRPQGITLADADTLYVADTENHAIRRVDLAARTVTTVAGTGGQVYMQFQVAQAAVTGLNSPWDVLAVDGRVFIAMAGQHQLYALEPDTGTLRLHAGTGREELLDGPQLEGALNQPSGLATDGQQLFFADSEASAIRSAGLDTTGILETIVGLGLFEFGDVDGIGDAVRLQHPLGLALVDDDLYIADTYNHKIKRLVLGTGEVQTVAGGDVDGWQDGDALAGLLDEPGGLSYGAGRLFIADTNNHAIRILDLDTGELTTLALRDPQSLLMDNFASAVADGAVRLPAATVAPGVSELRITIELPENHRLNGLAPLTGYFASESGVVSFGVPDFSAVEPELPIVIPVEVAQGDDVVSAELTIYYCSYDAVELCFIDQVTLELPVTVSDDGGDGLDMLHVLPKPFDQDPL